MAHNVVPDLTATVAVAEGSVVSKVIHRDDQLNVTMFGFDAGEGLTEHRTSRTALVQVISGRLKFIVDGEEHDAGPGYWLQMAPDTPHALEAVEPTLMLLTIVRP